jgi:hypothetical protein
MCSVLRMMMRVEEGGGNPLLVERVRNAQPLRQATERAFMEAVRHAVARLGGYAAREIARAAGILPERGYRIAAGRR